MLRCEHFARVGIGEKGEAVARSVDEADVKIFIFSLQQEADIDFAVEVFAGKVRNRLFLARAYGIEQCGKGQTARRALRRKGVGGGIFPFGSDRKNDLFFGRFVDAFGKGELLFDAVKVHFSAV